MKQIRDVISKYDGQLVKESELGAGSQFSITFPRCTAPEWIADEIEINEDDLVIKSLTVFYLVK